jgi:hypothetical protein
MKTVLASLALHPQVRIVLLIPVQFKASFNIKLFFLRLTIDANGLAIRYYTLASQTRFVNHCVLSEPTIHNFGNVDISGVLAHKQNLLR